MAPVDLRSDTVTRPTSAMREAMFAAKLGDDVLGDDPTAQELEALTAAMTGKEAALWLPTGTMANQVSLGAHTRPGDAIVADAEAHILFYEVGAPAALWGLMTWTVDGEGGVPIPERIEARITGENLHTPGTALVCVEDTHNRAGGAVIPLDRLRAVRAVADAHGVPVHMDGARVMNAVAAGGGSLREIAASVDSLTICLSKGLGAPAGTVLAGPRDLIDRALRLRKRLGGGMRQIGFLCAAGIHALTVNSLRLGEDHARAARLAAGLQGLPGLRVPTPETNIVLLELDCPAAEWTPRLHELGILCLPAAPKRIRMVTHHDVDDAGIDRAIAAVQRIAMELAEGSARESSPRATELSRA